MLGNVSAAVLVRLPKIQPLHESVEQPVDQLANQTTNALSNESINRTGGAVPETDQWELLAKWPANNNVSNELRSLFPAVLEKQRLQLRPAGDGVYLLGHPLTVAEAFWGILVCKIELPDKTELPALLKAIKLSQVWLQFIVQLVDGGLFDSNPSDKHAPLLNSQPVSIPPSISNSQANLTLPPADFINAALLQMTSSLLKETSLQEVCITLVNLVAGFLRATRVSLGLLDQRGKNVRVEAVSFSAHFDPRTHTLLAVREAMAEALDQGVRIDCVATPANAANTGGMNDPGDVVVDTLVKESHRHLLHTQQLQSATTLVLRKKESVAGVLTIELDRTKLNSDEEFLLQQIGHSAAAIILFHQQAAASVWHGLRHRIRVRLQRWLGNDSWRAKLALMGAAAFIVALFLPVDYELSADASLQTKEKYLVVSPQDAYLGSINARPGDAVKKGTLLAELNDEALRLERRKVASQAQQYRQAYDSALASGNRVEAAIASAQLDQANIQVQLIDQQLQRTHVLAPVDGVIVSDDISQTRGAPVKQGDVLFEIAAGQQYLAHLFVDERDIALVKPGQSSEIKLTSLPNDIFPTRVRLITPISEVREGRNYFRVELEFAGQTEALVLLRPGMTGTGKVHAGSRSLGWVLFHDIWHWLRLALW